MERVKMQMMLHERTGTAFGVAGVIYKAEGVRGFWRGNGAHPWAILKAAMLEMLQSSQLLPAKHIYALREQQTKVSGYSWAEPIAGLPESTVHCIMLTLHIICCPVGHMCVAELPLNCQSAKV